MLLELVFVDYFSVPYALHKCTSLFKLVQLELLVFH